ncbi:hypothetical protein VULLAG_LOCUS16913 [Vulpes lagopus]
MTMPGVTGCGTEDLQGMGKQPAWGGGQPRDTSRSGAGSSAATGTPILGGGGRRLSPAPSFTAVGPSGMVPPPLPFLPASTSGYQLLPVRHLIGTTLALHVPSSGPRACPLTTRSLTRPLGSLEGQLFAPGPAPLTANRGATDLDAWTECHCHHLEQRDEPRWGPSQRAFWCWAAWSTEACTQVPAPGQLLALPTTHLPECLILSGGRPEAVTHAVATLDRKPTEGDSHGAEARAGGLEVRETSLQSLYCVLIVLEEHPSGTKLLGECFSVSLWRAHFVSP